MHGRDSNVLAHSRCTTSSSSRKCSYRDTPTATTPCRRAFLGREDDLLPIHAYFNFAFKCLAKICSLDEPKALAYQLPGQSYPASRGPMLYSSLFRCLEWSLPPSSLGLLRNEAHAVRSVKDPRLIEKNGICVRKGSRMNRQYLLLIFSMRGMWA